MTSWSKFSRWNAKRETGFLLKWRFEDYDGNPVTSEPIPLYIESNGNFRYWTNLFFYLIRQKGIENTQIINSIVSTKVHP